MMLQNLIIPLIITIVLIIAFVTTFTIVFKNASEKAKLMPIRILFFILVALEIAKIFYLIGRDGGFYPNRYPIVFCSMIMYAIPLFCFKQNRFSDVAKGFCIIPSILAFIMFAAIQYKYNMSIMQVHSYIYHGSMLAIALYLITSKLYRFEFKKFFSQFLAVSGYILIASCLSLFVGGAISVFGPSDPYLAFIYKPAGFLVGIVIMIIAVFVTCFAVYGIIELCSRKIRKKARTNEEGLKKVENV